MLSMGFNIVLLALLVLFLVYFLVNFAACSAMGVVVGVGVDCLIALIDSKFGED